MTLAKGPRPWPIWAFALIFLGIGLAKFLASLSDLGTAQRQFEAWITFWDWNEDWTIVASSARFTIVLIPIALIVLFAKQFARWLVAAMVLANSALIIYAAQSKLEFSDTLLILFDMMWPGLLGVILLYTPSANRYFAQEEAVDASTFE